MVRELMHDPMFLGMKSRQATKDDAEVARDLLDTLSAHRETCVGMAANMIGKTVRIIAFFDGMKQSSQNPRRLKQRRAACRFSARRERPRGTERSG